MLVNAFIGKPKQPTPRELTAELGDCAALWEHLLTDLAKEYRLTKREWNSYSPKAGWSLRVKSGDRNIVYLSPGRGRFMASFALGDKAMAAARKTSFAAPVKRLLAQARRYAEGSAVRLEVKNLEDVATVKKLVEIKLGN